MILILQELKRILSYQGLGIDQYDEIRGYRIPRMMIRATFIFGVFSMATIQIINIWNSRDLGLQVMLLPVQLLLHIVIIGAVYLFLNYKTDKIADLMDKFEMVVQRRKLFDQLYGSLPN